MKQRPSCCCPIAPDTSRPTGESPGSITLRPAWPAWPAQAGALYVARFVDVIYLLRPLVVLVAAAPLIVICLFLWSVLRSLLGRFSRSIRHTGIRSATLGFRVDYSKADHVLRFKLLNLDYAERFARLNKSGAG